MAVKTKNNILISFVGINDEGKLNNKPDGAILTLLKSQIKFQEIHLIWTKSDNEKTDFYKIASYLENEIKKRNHCKNVFSHPLVLKDVTDHNEIYPKLLTLLKEKFDKNAKTTTITAAISSGTPSMQVCWILIAESGDSEIELLRVKEPKFSKEIFSEVKLGTGLPRIMRLEEEVRSMKPEVVLKIKPPTLSIDNQDIALGALEFCYYRYFLSKAANGEKYMQVNGYELPRNFLESIIKYHTESFPEQDQDIRNYKDMLKNDENILSNKLHPTRTKINNKIKDSLNNPNRSRYCEIESEGMKTAKKYGINLPKKKIKILK